MDSSNAATVPHDSDLSGGRRVSLLRCGAFEPLVVLPERFCIVPPLLRLIRPRQWVKNAFVVAPLFFTPGLLSSHNIGVVALGVACFCLLASSVYIINDYMDRETDRQHPEKAHRPLAAGTVTPAQALTFLVLMMIGACALAVWLGRDFALIALLYLVTNLLYSLALKRLSIVDVMLVALGYVLRVYAGAALIGVTASVWIISCTLLVSLFIALAKRRDDVARDLGAGHRAALKGYNKPFLDASIAIVLASLVVSYLIYTTEPHAGTDRLYLTTPFVIMGVLRYLQIALVEERSGAPTSIVTTDRFLILCVVAWVCSYGALVYG
jgi:4-hydroxybenzoate polyprenyltransferase